MESLKPSGTRSDLITQYDMCLALRLEATDRRARHVLLMTEDQWIDVLGGQRHWQRGSGIQLCK